MVTIDTSEKTEIREYISSWVFSIFSFITCLKPMLELKSIEKTSMFDFQRMTQYDFSYCTKTFKLLMKYYRIEHNFHNDSSVSQKEQNL